ncbi:MAG: isoprenylcysteine carboxylmethyltransferase family protein [Desulfobulbaceae bacterium]|jgi:protein-S-isoprenylcysteine O-methyltransferase Ste14|nr:isoprenylcysteine carboxylmethyltransferase family protein [Desulfobulbaceae bacterium]
MINNIIPIVISLSVVSVFLAIFIDFILYGEKDTVKKSKRVIVATGSMIGFYFVYYLVLRFRLGNFDHNAHILIVFLGTAMVVTGAVTNILGRLQLKGNWANHIKVYEDHTLINHGVYKLVRHPLYASIMLMLLGGSLVYRNWLSAALTAFIFIPFMYYRAKQEEALLREEFAEYENYIKNTGMFFPKLRGGADGTGAV